MEFPEQHILECSPEAREWWRESMMVRLYALGDRLGDIESLRDDLLEENKFDASCMFKEWVIEEIAEAEQINSILQKLEGKYGPVPRETEERVKAKIKNFFEETP